MTSTDASTKTMTISGYEAELIRLLAERSGKSPEEFVISFFDGKCNALTDEDRKSTTVDVVSFSREVQCTTRGPSWQTGAEVRANIGNVTRAWLYQFAATHAADVRRMGDAKNCRLLYRAAAVADALERKESCA